MSVFGIDVGNYASRVGVARAGGVEILPNEYSDRATLSYVAITNNERLFGHNARQQQPMNLKSTFNFFKRLLGHRFNDIEQSELPHLEYEAIKGEGGAICVKAEFGNERRTFSIPQIHAMMLAKLTSSAVHACGLSANIEMTDCVLSVPVFATDIERRALLECTRIANINCLRVLPDTTAAALCYGLYHQDLPQPNEESRLVAFVDIGYTSVQCAVVAFNQGRLKVLGVSYDANLGGRDFDRALSQPVSCIGDSLLFKRTSKISYRRMATDSTHSELLAEFLYFFAMGRVAIMFHFKDEIQKVRGVDISKGKRGWLRLGQQCERIKKMMSTISAIVPIDVECLVEGEDYHSQMCRSDFEDLCANLFDRIKKTMSDVLTNAQVEKVHSVEIVGGSTRLPRVKTLIREVFGHEASTTLNADEAVARGCTLMCAILSPNFKVREYKIEDCQPYPITISWKGSCEDEDTEVEVFNHRSSVPMSKMLSFYKSEPLVLDARYSYPNDVPIGNPSKVKVKVRINRNGILEINQAFLVETVEEEVPTSSEPAEPAVSADDAAAAGAQSEDQNSGLPQTITEEDKKVKQKVKNHPLTVVAKPTFETNPDNLLRLIEQEAEMQAMDKQQKERADAKNALEEYIYEMRDKLGSSLSSFVGADDKTRFSRLLNESEKWLLDDDESEVCEKNVFVSKLNVLKSMGDPIKKRAYEFTHKTPAFEKLAKQIQLFEKAYHLWSTKKSYQHISEDEMSKVMKAIEDKRRWLFEKQAQSAAVSPEKDCTVFNVAAIKQQQADLERVCNGVLNKPVPPPPPPPKKKADPSEKTINDSAGTADNGKGNASDEGFAQQQQQQQQSMDDAMDVD
ncbi:hypothetical protein ACOME3_008399 [Neoechinorhynchus agilis]